MNIFQVKCKNASTWSCGFTAKFMLGLLRYTFWHCFINVSLYHMHFSSVHHDKKLLEKVPLLTLGELCAVAFVCCAHTKYVAIMNFQKQQAKNLST